MNRVQKIFGPPGTGKTTRLLSIAEQAMASGIRPERIAMMAFTKKAAHEAAERAKARFQLTDEQLPHFRTLHSMAFHDLFARRDDVMQATHFRELANTLGFQFSNYDDELGMATGTSLGDRVQQIESLSRVRNISLEQQWHESIRVYSDVELESVKYWAEGLQRYKLSHGMMDFTDMLEQFNTELEVDLFIVDEAQDLSALQWKVVRRACAKAKQVYIAGDDDQCIYDWAGADVNHFLRIKADVEVLPVSFRLPRKIHRFADAISQRIRVRQPKKWESRAEDGAIYRLATEAALDLSKGSWMLLARNRRTLKRFEDVLISQGYPYLKEGQHSTDNAVTRAIRSWEHWRRGNPLQPKDVRPISALMPELANWNPREAVFIEDAPLQPVRRRQTWMEALDIEPTRREYLRLCLFHRENLTAVPRISISTIHRVKGGEADHVALIPDLSPLPWKARNTDGESRVLYVGITRARQTLTLIQPQSPRYYSL